MKTEILNWQNCQREAPPWFRDAKFGLFFHWGPYSVPEHGSEWYSRNMYETSHEQNIFHQKTFGSVSEFGYKDLFPLFTAERFNPTEWAWLVKKSGARYAGPVCEHADNYAMWDSFVNPVNAVKTGPKRDIVGELFAAFQKENIRRLATFHHQWLWGWFMSPNPAADVYQPQNSLHYGRILPMSARAYAPHPLPDEAFCAVWRDKVLEVILQYSPDALYFDSRANIIPDQYKQQVLDALYRRTDTVATYKQFDFPTGTAVVDIECGRFSQCKDFVWQVDDKLEALPTWCYTRSPVYKPAVQVIHQLCDIVAKNGNLLLNVGPKADGSFDVNAVRILEEIGAWLAVCGEAIFETRPYATAVEGPAIMTDNNFDIKKINAQVELGYMMEDSVPAFTAHDFRFTCKGNTVYALMLGWPEDGKVRIESFGYQSDARQIRRITMLGHHNHSLTFHRTEQMLEIVCPQRKPCEHAWVFRFEE